MPSKNPPRALNLDDIDEELEETGVGANEALFDQEVDFESIKGTKVVERGEYFLQNVGYELKLSKRSKQPMVTFRIQIQSGPEEGTTVFQDFPWPNDDTKKYRSKKAFIGMGLPEGFRGSLRQIAEALAAGDNKAEYYGFLDVEQSEGINDRTQMPYDPRNRLTATSLRPQTTG